MEAVLKSRTSKLVLLSPFLLFLVASLGWFVWGVIESPKDGLLPENISSFLIPNIYLGVAISIILLPQRPHSTSQQEWPLLRCLLLFGWALLGQLPEPLCGAEVSRAHRLFCLALDAIFLGRLALARFRHERDQDWRYYCVLLVFAPIISLLVMSIRCS